MGWLLLIVMVWAEEPVETPVPDVSLAEVPARDTVQAMPMVGPAVAPEVASLVPRQAARSALPLPQTEWVYCFSPEVKLKFGRQSRVELYPAAKQLPSDWQEVEPDPPRAFNLGGPQDLD